MHQRSDVVNGPRPLDGIRVLELGQILAGPLASAMLAYFGAEVVKVEPPGGDPIRSWRVLDEDGTSLWWRSLGRNKKLVCVDLRDERGRDVVRRLAAKADVVIENFKPGRLESWGMGPDVLREDNPSLIITRISGYGQDGPYRDRRGFASVCEAFGGLRYVTGHPGQTPVRSNLSVGDSLSAFQAVIGTLLALFRRERDATRPAETVDVAIYEAVFNVMEAAVTEFDRRGVVREPSGTTITGVVPTDAYPCADGRRVVIGANGDSIYRRLMRAAGRDDLADDPRMATNDGRVAHQAELDQAIAAWTSSLSSDAVLESLLTAGVPSGPIQTAADMRANEHFQARGMFEPVDINGTPTVLPAMGPKLANAPGKTTWPGGSVGADTDDVLRTWAGIQDDELASLHAADVIR